MGTFEARKSYPLTGHDQNSINSPTERSIYEISEQVASKKPRKECNICKLASAICLLTLQNNEGIDLSAEPTNQLKVRSGPSEL